MKRFLALAAAAAMSAVCFVGCGSSKDDFVGKWQAKSMTTDGKTIEGEFMGISIGAIFQVEFKDDETGRIIIHGKEDTNFDWKADGDKVDVTVDGKTVTFEKEGDDIKAEKDDTSFTLKKVDEFSKLDLSKLGIDEEESN